MVELFVNSGDPDQMLQNAASDLDLHCLPVTCLAVSSPQWVKRHFALFRYKLDGTCTVIFFTLYVYLLFGLVYLESRISYYG